MVNRSKPSLAIRRLNESRRSSLAMENSVIKSKNLALAKELAESKQKYTELFKEIVAMRSKLFEVETMNMKLTQVIRRIDSYGKFCVTKLVGISDDVTQILQETARFTCVQEFNQVEEVSLQSNKNGCRTRAVKPMISGHTIVRPTITLQRVTAEQLEQLRNSTNGGDVNGEEYNSHENGHADSLASERTSPLSDEQVNDTNDEEEEEEEEVNNNSINEQSEANSQNLNRLSTLQEESINNITQINKSRTLNDSANSLHTARFQEARVNLSPLSVPVTPTTGWNYTLLQLNSARNPIVKLHPLTSQQNTNLAPTEQNASLTSTVSSSNRNSTKEISNLQVNLCQLPSDVLKNFSALNKKNLNGNGFTNNPSKPSTRFLLMPTHRKDLNHSPTNRELSSRELLHDLTNNTSILNDITAKNSLTKFRENGMDDALEESLNVSTLVNVSLETGRLSDCLESVGDLTHSNIVNKVIERQERLINEKDQPCRTVKGTASTVLISNKLSEDPKLHVKSKRDSSSLTPVENRTCCVDTSSYDPLEGPSTLLDNTKSFGEKFTLLNRLGLTPSKNTSTPYTPTKVTFRRKRINPFYSPHTWHLSESTMLKKKSQENSSPVSSLKVNMRERNAPRVSSINIKHEKSSLDHYTNCSVNITRLSNTVLTQNLENIPAKMEVKEEPSRTTSLKRRTSPSKKKKLEERRKLKYKSSPVKISPRKRRPRIHTPGALKEPSLNKKLRRSK